MTSNEPIDRQPAIDRAVSPVIGVIMMVAITVILAAVIGTFVLDMGATAGNTAPSASLQVTANAETDNVTIRHTGGDGVDSSVTRIAVEKTNASATESAAFGATAGPSVLSVGEVAVVSLGTPEGVDWTGDGGLDSSGDETFGNIASGDRLTVTLIDTGSQRVLYETVVLA